MGCVICIRAEKQREGNEKQENSGCGWCSASDATLCFCLGADSISLESIKQQRESTGLRSLWWLRLQDESAAADGAVSTKLRKEGKKKLEGKDLISAGKRPQHRHTTTKYAKTKGEAAKERYAVALDEKSKEDRAVDLTNPELLQPSVFKFALSYRCRSSRGEETTPAGASDAGGRECRPVWPHLPSTPSCPIHC